MSNKPAHKTNSVNFRATDEQVKRIETIASTLGKRPSEVMRELIDSAALVRSFVVLGSNSGTQDKTAQHAS